MAIMIPERPRRFDSSSMEGIMFDALALLPDQYYVFHSMRISEVKENTFYESEADFVIFHPEKGMICIEAKAGAIQYSGGRWLYASGIPMSHDGPYNQAASNKWKLLKYIKESRHSDLVKHCKFLHAVWFPSLSEQELRQKTFPPEADKRITLPREALSDPLKYIEQVFSVELPNGKQTSLSQVETRSLIRDILCPEFKVTPSVSFESDIKKTIFHRLLREQANILNFLQDQKFAVINGAAGTGKTLIAVEKAHRHASEGEKVLFLCYNVKLKNHLAEYNVDSYIDFYTIDGFACKMCNTTEPDYTKLKSLLEDMSLSGRFPYQHIIVDEGQDFGAENIEDTEILDMFRTIIDMEDKKNTSFYVFYDELQLIQARRMPDFIKNADCKLTLYRNCRNTENIAVTSLTTIHTKRKLRLIEGCVKGIPTHISFNDSLDSSLTMLNASVDSLVAAGMKDIVILTCKTETSSFLSPYIKDGKYRNKYPVSTCRKFKGLEADAVILIDVTTDTFSDDGVLLFYVGASRARLMLEIVSELKEPDCVEILQKIFNENGKIKNAKRKICKKLNAVVRIQ